MVLGNVLGVVLIISATWRVKSVGASAGLRTVIRFAAPAYAANVLQYLNYRLDLFLVAYFETCVKSACTLLPQHSLSSCGSSPARLPPQCLHELVQQPTSRVVRLSKPPLSPELCS